MCKYVQCVLGHKYPVIRLCRNRSTHAEGCTYHCVSAKPVGVCAACRARRALFTVRSDLTVPSDGLCVPRERAVWPTQTQLREVQLTGRGLPIPSVLLLSGCSSPSLCPLPSAPFSPLAPPRLSPLSNNVTVLPAFSQFYCEQQAFSWVFLNASVSFPPRCQTRHEKDQQVQKYGAGWDPSVAA